MPVEPGIIGWSLSLMPILFIVAWAAMCLWAFVRLQRMEIALVSKVVWGVAILLAPVLGFLAFLLLGERTAQMERELGIRRLT